jgi:acyl-CoA synthetase (AMP-forming)/AMP-acid ligase II
MSVARLSEYLPEKSLLVNMYIPAECTIQGVYHKVDRAHINTQYIPLGKPLVNYEIYLLNEKQQLVIPGQIGEIYVSGACVFNGYVNQPQLTEQVRLILSHITHHSNPIYKTGDLAKQLLPSGDIVFMGRADHQVKLRGQRLEVGEIENIIIQSDPSLITQCLVIKLVGDNNNEYLAAYCVINNSCPFSSEILAGNSWNTSSAALQLRSSIYKYCQSKLSSYMLPSAIIILGENRMKQLI